ncbi:MAG: hypothetical protein HQK53_05605 [Oligoflexia bacterium]|nr:hypothetical protein [Oligoflexia bacterium]
MYDYSAAESFKIENVDHEIHILGVTFSSVAYSVGVYGVSLPFCGPLAMAMVLIYLLISRQFFLARERGEPIEYNENWVRYLKIIPWVESMFGLDKLIYSEGRYRG